MAFNTLKTIQKFLHYALRRKSSEENYFEFQRFQARLVINDLARYIKFDRSTKILDIGSGIGGYLYEFSRLPCNKVVSLDKNPLQFTLKKFCGVSNVEIIEGDITKTQFKDESFDLVIASSIIEHVEEQKKMIEECKRILKKTGIFYLSFPPYYSLRGGHAISPFHYLPGELPLKLYSFFYKAKHRSFKYYGLIKTTISSAKGLVRKDFKIICIKARVFNFLNPFVKIPIINEFLIPHVEFFLRKN